MLQLLHIYRANCSIIILMVEPGPKFVKETYIVPMLTQYARQPPRVLQEDMLAKINLRIL